MHSFCIYNNPILYSTNFIYKKAATFNFKIQKNKNNCSSRNVPKFSLIQNCMSGACLQKKYFEHDL